MSTAEAAAPAKRKGAIHDLGYKRYVGSRRPQSTRWRVIMRHQIVHGWKTWWRYKTWVGLALIATIIVGAIMVVMRSDTMDKVRMVDEVYRMTDTIVFQSIGWFCKFAFLATLTVGAGIISADLRTGAFTFYFARPVRPVDYVLGKLGGLFVLQAILVLAPLLAITLVRLGLSENTDELIRNLEYVPKALLIGTLGALTYAAAALGFSAILENPRQTTALWAALYVIGGFIAVVIGVATKTPWVGAIDIAFSLESFSYALYDFTPFEVDTVYAGLVPTATSLVLWSAVGIGIAYWRVRATGSANIGGS